MPSPIVSRLAAHRSTAALLRRTTMPSPIVSRLSAHSSTAALLHRLRRSPPGGGAPFSPANRWCQFSVARRYHLGGPYGLHSYPVVPIQKSRPFCTTGTDKVNVEGIEQNKKITVTFVDKDGEETVIKVPVGMSMLEAAHENDIELEGACEGSLACSTCHVIVMDIPYYNKLEDPTDEENDMLDLAFGLTETSRLGCQVIAMPELDGIRLALPAATRNFAVDGHVPKPH